MDNFINPKVAKLEHEIYALKEIITEMQRAYQQRLVTMTNEEVDAVFSKYKSITNENKLVVTIVNQEKNDV